MYFYNYFLKYHCGPAFFTCVPTRRQDSLFIYLVKNMIFRKYLKSPLIFVLLFFLKRKQNKKENPRVTPYLEKTCLQKSNLGPGFRLPVGKVGW